MHSVFTGGIDRPVEVVLGRGTDRGKLCHLGGTDGWYDYAHSKSTWQYEMLCHQEALRLVDILLMEGCLWGQIVPLGRH